MAAISGKSLAVAWELPPVIGTNSEQVLKSLVSRDTVQIEKKHKDPINIIPRATVYIAANAPPKFTDHTYGLERKIEAFAFNQRIDDSEKVVGYDKEITGDPAELAVALDWMLDGITRLVSRGGFTEQTASQKALTETIKIESDSVYAYLQNEVIVLPDDLTAKRWWTSKKAIYTAYREYVLDSGQKPVAAPQFWRTLKQRMEASGQQLLEVRSRSSHERRRDVNLIKADADEARAAEQWIKDREAAKNRSMIIIDDSENDGPIPF
jgi:phage/plasmid-associated DNA primase